MKVQEALKAALEAIDLYDYTGTQAESELYAKAESLCKSALSDIGKCEPVGEVQGVAVNWYHGTPADYSLLYTSPISKEWVEFIREVWMVYYDGSEGYPANFMYPTQVYDTEEQAKANCFRDAYSPKKVLITDTPPISKEWVGLSEETIDDIGNTLSDEQGFIPVETWTEFARAIEAKLKQLNVPEKG